MGDVDGMKAQMEYLASKVSRAGVLESKTNTTSPVHTLCYHRPWAPANCKDVEGSEFEGNVLSIKLAIPLTECLRAYECEVS